jgi:hypothetical protein
VSDELMARRIIELERIVRRHDNLFAVVLVAGLVGLLAWIF